MAGVLRLGVGRRQQQPEHAIGHHRGMADDGPGGVLPRHGQSGVVEVAAEVGPQGAVVGALRTGEGRDGGRARRGAR